MRDELDLLRIDEGVMLPDNLLNFASLANADYARRSRTPIIDGDRRVGNASNGL